MDHSQGYVPWSCDIYQCVAHVFYSDIILKVAGILTIKGGTGAIVEYKGPGVESLSATGMATTCNVGAEIGATTSFPFNHCMADCLKATNRSDITNYARTFQHNLTADGGAKYDQTIHINLSELEPHINVPFTPDFATPLSKFAAEVEKNSWPHELKVGLISSCTNPSYEDMSRAAFIAKEAANHGLSIKSKFTITPVPSRSVLQLPVMDKSRLSRVLATWSSLTPAVLALDSGIGRTSRGGGDVNSVITSYNLNFTGWNDANPCHRHISRHHYCSRLRR